MCRPADLNPDAIANGPFFTPFILSLHILPSFHFLLELTSVATDALTLPPLGWPLLYLLPPPGDKLRHVPVWPLWFRTLGSI